MPIQNILAGALSSGLSSGVSSLIGGLFGRKKKKTTSSTVNYVALRKAAEAGGFNPLTALRNGGAAGFQQTHHPAMASSEIVGNAISNGINSFMAYDPRDEERADLEQEIMRAQLERINQTNDYYRNLEVPSAQGSRVTKTTGKNPMPTLADGAVPAFDFAPDGVTLRDTQVEPEKQLPATSKVTFHDTTMIGPNPEVFEVGIGEILGGAMIYGPQYVWQKGRKLSRQRPNDEWLKSSRHLSRINQQHY